MPISLSNQFLTDIIQYADYSLGAKAAANAEATSAPAALAGPAPPKADDPQAEINVTPQAGLDQAQAGMRHTEERVEYRDENGRLLDDNEVKALEGKVSFSTRYETRTRILDEAGSELYEGLVENAPNFAGTLAVGENPETLGATKPSDAPPNVDVDTDIAKEKKIDNSKQVAEPESDLGSATGKDEL